MLLVYDRIKGKNIWVGSLHQILGINIAKGSNVIRTIKCLGNEILSCNIIILVNY